MSVVRSKVGEDGQQHQLAEHSLVSTAKQIGGGAIGGILTFVKELDRIKEQQLLFTNKLENEKRRKEILDENLEIASRQLREYQGKTRNGIIVKENDAVNQKQIHRLEQQLQAAKVKLSVARRNNQVLRAKVDQLRKEKLMQLKILDGLTNEMTKAKDKVVAVKEEVVTVNEKKYRVKQAVSSIKHKMMKDMEEFSKDLSTARQDISSAQENILGSIRDKMQSQMQQIESSRIAADTNAAVDAELAYTLSWKPPLVSQDDSATRPTGAGGAAGAGEAFSNNATASSSLHDELMAVIKESGCSTLTEFVAQMNQFEEDMFIMYAELQEKSDEMDRVERENKHLEQRLETEEEELQVLEKNKEQRKHDVEETLNRIQEEMSKYVTSYNHNMEVLNSIYEGAMNLLRNVAMDGEATDRQMLTTGINDRNIEDYLGLIEGRIDDLIQMSKAAMKLELRRDDFVPRSGVAIDRRTSAPVAHSPFGHSLRPPTLPSLQDDDDAEDNDENIRVQPLNIAHLKANMQRRILKGMRKKERQANGEGPQSILAVGGASSVGGATGDDGSEKIFIENNKKGKKTSPGGKGSSKAHRSLVGDDDDYYSSDGGSPRTPRSRAELSDGNVTPHRNAAVFAAAATAASGPETKAPTTTESRIDHLSAPGFNPPAPETQSTREAAIPAAEQAPPRVVQAPAPVSRQPQIEQENTQHQHEEEATYAQNEYEGGDDGEGGYEDDDGYEEDD